MGDRPDPYLREDARVQGDRAARQRGPIEVRGRPPRATVVVYRLNDIGGAEASTVLFLERLARTEFETRVIVLTGASDFRAKPELEARGMVFVDVHAGWPGRARALMADLRHHRPDLVHTTLFGADALGRLTAPLVGAPVLVSIVNMQYSPEAVAVAPSPRKLDIIRRGERFLSRHLTTAFHALTAATGAYATTYLGADPKRIVVVPRGRLLGRYEVSAERASAAREALGIDAGIPVIVNFARQEPQKGQDLLLEAFAKVLERHPDALLLIGGREGTATPLLQATTARLGIEGSVRFLGVRDDVPELLAACTLFVSSARYEGFGGAVLEAMASGSAIVAFGIAPVAEVLGGTGRLVPLGDTDAFADAVSEVIADPELRAQMGADAKAEAQRRFSADSAAAQLADLYRDVITDPERFPRPWITRCVARLRRR